MRQLSGKLIKFIAHGPWIIFRASRTRAAQGPSLKDVGSKPTKAFFGLNFEPRYDAVTIEGKLKWQNGLTDLNLPFFEESNSIFTNYTFKEDHLKASQKISGDKSRKIYAGVDVFGRGKARMSATKTLHS